jgi:hypothetical protein
MSFIPPTNIIDNLNDYAELSNYDFENFDILLDEDLKVNYGDLKNGIYNYSTYFDNLGRPKSNIERNNIDNNFVKDINNTFRERRNITESIIDDLKIRNADIDTTDFDKDFMSDFFIDGKTTNIEVSFISEGAGYKNVFGYYFYRLQEYKDSDGITKTKPVVLYGGDYNPTIFFPNGSKKNGGGNLITGDTRKVVLGKSIDITNVNVGFFLIPNGWDSSRKIVRYNNKKVIHSTPRMNHNWNNNLDSTNNSFLNNNGYQSLLTRYYVNSDDFIYCFTFEDISRPSGDKDYNDMVMLVKLIREDNTEPSTETPIFTDPIDPETETGTERKSEPQLENSGVTESPMLEYTDRGMFIQLLQSEFEPKINTCYQIDYTFTVTKEQFEIISPAIVNLNFISDNKAVDKTSIKIDDETRTIVISHQFTYSNQAEIDESVNEFKNCYQIQVFDAFDNYDGEEPTQDLLDVQHILVEDAYLSDENITLTNCDTEEEIMKKDDGPVIIARSLLLWGDPHIVTIYGKSYMMKDIEGVFRLFENNELLIKGEFWTLNKFNNHPVLHNRTFMKKITINFKNHHLNIKIDINKTKAYLLLGDNKEIEIENKKDFIMNDFRITHHNKIKTVDIYKNINTKSIRFENNDFYIELFNVDHIDDLQNFFEINTKYLSKSSYNDKARGLLIKNCEENYEVINSMS